MSINFFLSRGQSYESPCTVFLAVFVLQESFEENYPKSPLLFPASQKIIVRPRDVATRVSGRK